MMLTTEEIGMIVVDVMKGSSPRVVGDEADAFRVKFNKDLEIAKENGWTIELPFEIPGTDETVSEVGTPASGHYHHKGIPGHRGGSAPDAGVKRLKDEVPFRPSTIESTMSSLKCSRETAEKLLATSKQMDPNKVIINRALSQSAQDKVRVGRNKISKVHKEIPGYAVDPMDDSQAQMHGFQKGSLGGLYSGRHIFILPRATSDTFVHEYGHYIDNLLGYRDGKLRGEMMSDSEPLFAESPYWVAHETFAEFYTAWIGTKGDWRKALPYVDMSFEKKWPGLAEKWDSMLREELEMK